MKCFSIPSNETDLSAPTINVEKFRRLPGLARACRMTVSFSLNSGLVLECGINGSLENMHSIRVAKDEESINAISFYFDENALHLAATTRWISF